MAKRKNNAKEKAKCDQKILNGLKLLLNSEEYITRNELCALLNESDRKIREAKKVLSYDISILSDTAGKGYRRVNHSYDKVSELKTEAEQVIKQLAYINSYINSLKMTMRPLIASKKVLQFMINEKEQIQNENGKLE